nr:MAG TPA: hypothetical protein [Caudoviricetes sp.]
MIHTHRKVYPKGRSCGIIRLRFVVPQEPPFEILFPAPTGRGIFLC